MKIKFLSSLFFLLFLNSAFAQEGFIIDKDGKKIIVGGDKVELLSSFEEFEYQQSGSNKKSKIKLKNIKSANFLGFYHIETFTINKQLKPCFIIAETPKSKLVGYNEIHNQTYFTGPGKSNTRSYVKYFYYVLDNQNNLIEELKFMSFYSERSEDKRDDVESKVRNHFSDCPDLISRLNAYDPNATGFESVSDRAKKWTKKFEEGNAKILYLFNNPDYSMCDKSAVEVSDIQNQTQTTSAVSDYSKYYGVYGFSSVSMEYRGSKKDMPITGTYTLKDGFVEITTKDTSIKYKIKNVQNGVIYCEDRNMTHLLRIVPETGKKKGKDYDTRINIIMDKELGGSITDYWCKKM